MSRPCDIVTNAVAVTMSLPGHLVSQLPNNSSQDDIEEMAQFLRGHAWCAIGIFELHGDEEDPLEAFRLFQAVERVLHNTVIILGFQTGPNKVDVSGMGQKMTFLEVMQDSQVIGSIDSLINNRSVSHS